MQIFQKVILLKVPGYSAIYAMGNGNFSAIIIVNKNYKQAPFFFFLNKYIILKIQDYLVLNLYGFKDLFSNFFNLQKN